jgi:hypothetical protein
MKEDLFAEIVNKDVVNKPTAGAVCGSFHPTLHL